MKKTYSYLIYIGSIPFILCAVYFIADLHDMPLLVSIERILSAYGLVILSFLAGSHWGQHLYLNKVIWGRVLAVMSNIITLSLWFGFLLLNFKMLMALFASVFFILIVIDYYLYLINLISLHYFQIRFLVSVIVIISLIISGIES